MKTAPIFSAASAISLLTAGSMVEESMSRVPFFTFLPEDRAEEEEEAEEEKGEELDCFFLQEPLFTKPNWKVSPFS